MRPSAPCRGCMDRHEACHDHCERYAEFKDILAVYNQAESDDRIARANHAEAVMKAKRRANRGRSAANRNK